MAKSLTGGQQTALEAAVVRPVAFLEIDWHADDGGPQRYCTSGAPIAWNTYTWTATGNLVDISPITEVGEVAATGIVIALSGVPGSLISVALQGKVQGRRVTMWLGLLDEAGALVGTPVLEFEGRGDTLAIEDRDDGATLAFKVESRMASLLGSVTRRYSDEDQQKFQSGDRIFRYVAQMAERSIVFPSADALRK